jgi:hypothetical protein
MRKPFRNRRLATPRTRLEEDNINPDLSEIGCEYRRTLGLAQDRVQRRALVLAVLNSYILVPQDEFVSLFVTDRNVVDGI